MESIWIPPTSSTKRVSRRSVSPAARGRARCCRSRKSARTAASEATGCFTASVTTRDLPIGKSRVVTLAVKHPVASLAAVRALFLERQHLARPRAAGLTERRLTRFVEDVGGIQMDSINVLERAHYLTVWSRFGSYDRARLDRLVYERRLLFEYWAHAACLVPTTTLPWWRRAMLDYRVRHTGWSNWLRRNAKVLSLVKASVQANGPMGNADVEGRRPAGGRRGWWDWKPIQHALHYLWMTGALTVDSRRHFQKRFDLLERAMPDVLGIEAVSSEEFQRWHLERSLHAMGAATEADLSRYLSFPRFMPG